MNLGRELYSGHNRYRRYLLLVFAGVGVFASVLIFTLSFGIARLEYFALSALSPVIPGALIFFNKNTERLDLRNICMFSLVNVALLLLLVAALRLIP
jgi:hypothetical protein